LFLAITFTAGPAGAAAAKSSSAKSSSSSSRSLAAYRTCLAKHGVKLPSGSGSRTFSGSFPHNGSFPGGSFPHNGSFPGGSFPGGSFPGGSFPHNGSFPGRAAPNSKTAKAFAACAAKAPKGFRGGFGGPGQGGTGAPTAAQTAALKNYDECMATHGVQIAASASYQTIRALVASDPAAATANASCQSDLSSAFGAPPSGSTTTTG
jgi:hypothetical protein